MGEGFAITMYWCAFYAKRDITFIVVYVLGLTVFGCEKKPNI